MCFSQVTENVKAKVEKSTAPDTVRSAVPVNPDVKVCWKILSEKSLKLL